MQCRYCLETSGELIHPCKCTTPVHHKCLVKWLETSNRVDCEICNHLWHDNVAKQIEEARVILNLVKASSFVILFNIFTSLMGLNIIAKCTLVATLVACALNVCNIVVFMPFIIARPYFAPVSMLTCLLFVGQRIIPIIDEYL